MPVEGVEVGREGEKNQKREREMGKGSGPEKRCGKEEKAREERRKYGGRKLGRGKGGGITGEEKGRRVKKGGMGWWVNLLVYNVLQVHEPAVPNDLLQTRIGSCRLEFTSVCYGSQCTVLVGSNNGGCNYSQHY